MKNKSRFVYNQSGVKSSCDCYRNINGIHYECWTSDNARFNEFIVLAKKEKLKYKIIKYDLFIERPERETSFWKYVK
jgi:hypothetical protein